MDIRPNCLYSGSALKALVILPSRTHFQHLILAHAGQILAILSDGPLMPSLLTALNFRHVELIGLFQRVFRHGNFPQPDRIAPAHAIIPEVLDKGKAQR